MKTVRIWVAALVLMHFDFLPPVGAAEGDGTGELRITEGLAVGGSGRAGRSAIRTDPVESLLVTGAWRRPREGDAVSAGDGPARSWKTVRANADGLFDDRTLRGGYLYAEVVSPGETVMVLEAVGHAMVYANGSPRVGDPYQYGYCRVPVALQAGTNQFLFATGRGRLKARLTRPERAVFFNLADTTLPDFVMGGRESAWAGLIVVNATTNALTGVALSAAAKAGTRPAVTFDLPPLGIRKLPVLLPYPRNVPTNGTATQEVTLVRWHGGRRDVLASVPVPVRVRQAGQSRRRTFLSGIDGSVQYYAIQPRRPGVGETESPALFLALHGASVEAMGNADAYGPKTWGHIVAPTNRRPYGFDWEDWGRLDALEVLEAAQRELRTDPRRVYLTGHSMGGHGTWSIGAHFPDRFAALGPSAGWISFMSYGAGGRRTEGESPMRALLDRSRAGSDTLLLRSNYLHHAIYILHGDADDNVPVSEARRMREELAKFHRNFDWHEQAGAGHWWESSDEPGAECMDWPPMFDLFARHRIPETDQVRQLRFTTVNPAVSSRCHWLTIEAQERSMEPSSVDLQWDPLKQRVTGTSHNVARLAIDPAALRAAELRLTIDRQELGPLTSTGGLGSGGLRLERRQGRWNVSLAAGSGTGKSPQRGGPFKQAFQNRMIFVHGTAGTSGENEWSLAKARFDAETFWYRGNGSVDLLSDVEFLARSGLGSEARSGRKHGDSDWCRRNVILYGNADINRAWGVLLTESPVQVDRGGVRVGERRIGGDDLACLFLRPAAHDPHVLVGAVAGTGLSGLRLTDRMSYFVSGAGFPDCTVFGAAMLTGGTNGVRAAGFFGNDWSVEQGDFTWAGDE